MIQKIIFVAKNGWVKLHVELVSHVYVQGADDLIA